jgi:hypothetical protein
MMRRSHNLVGRKYPGSVSNARLWQIVAASSPFARTKAITRATNPSIFLPMEGGERAFNLRKEKYGF